MGKRGHNIMVVIKKYLVRSKKIWDLSFKVSY